MARETFSRRGIVAGALGLTAPGGARAAGVKPKVVISTNHGKITVELEDRRAPLTSANFLRYVDAAAYDGGSFFRAARPPGHPTEGQIVGAANPKNHPFPGIAHEPTTQTGLRHLTGTLSLGRFEPGSATSNFFICASPEPYLDAHPGAPGDNLGYAAFGQVISGMAVVRKILASPTSAKSKFAEQKGEWLNPPIPIFSMRRLG